MDAILQHIQHSSKNKFWQFMIRIDSPWFTRLRWPAVHSLPLLQGDQLAESKVPRFRLRCGVRFERFQAHHLRRTWARTPCHGYHPVGWRYEGPAKVGNWPLSIWKGSNLRVTILVQSYSVLPRFEIFQAKQNYGEMSFSVSMGPVGLYGTPEHEAMFLEVLQQEAA